MPDLILEARYSHSQPKFATDRMILQGEHEWLVRGPFDKLAAIAESLPGMAEKLGDKVLLLNFGNAVGIFDLPWLERVEIVSGKWDRAHYDQMLQELTDTAVGLPFTADVTAALPYDRSVATQEDVLYHLFVYLRHILSDMLPIEQRLIPSLNLVLQTPHQHFERMQRRVALEHARQVHPSTLTRLLVRQNELVRVDSTHLAHLPLAQALRGHVPTHVQEHFVDSSYDTAENRFIKSFLGTLQGIIDQMRDVIASRRSDPFRQRIEADCDQMSHSLRPVVQHHLWHEVGPMVHLPASSPVLHHRRGYREVFRHFAKLRLATQIPLDTETARDLLEAKDIAQLYEIWSYFALVRELTGILGKPTHAERPRVGPTDVTVPYDLQVAWTDGTCIFYNRTFSNSKSARQERRSSYSVVLRPDITLYVPDGPNQGLHLLDAKFKVDKLDTLMPMTDDETDVHSEERRGTFKRGDLYKMHTYRDAVSDARSVWILYPGTEMRFFDARKEPTTSAPGVLPHQLDGVGAIPLLPDGDRDTLHTILRRLVEPGSGFE